MLTEKNPPQMKYIGAFGILYECFMLKNYTGVSFSYVFYVGLSGGIAEDMAFWHTKAVSCWFFFPSVISIVLFLYGYLETH